MENRTVVIGVTGGIAVYKALDVISKLKKKDFEVHVIMTESATKVCEPVKFPSFKPELCYYRYVFKTLKAWEIQHISLAKKADLL